jgi:glycosyltransferase involved in cell wall biosynthesis
MAMPIRLLRATLTKLIQRRAPLPAPGSSVFVAGNARPPSLRVLHVHSGNLYGGVETLLTTLARHRDLCPGMESRFALCFRGRLSEELVKAGAEVADVGRVRLRWPWTVWKARRRLRRLLRDGCVDVAVCHGCWGHAVFGPTIRSCGVPQAFWAHDVPRGDHWLERWARQTPPDLLLANSRFTQSALSRLFPGARSEVCYPGVLPPSQRGDHEEIRRAARAELQTPAGATVIVMVARMEQLKGHTVLLEALGRIRDDARWLCWIVGGAQRAKELTYQAGLTGQAARLGIAERVRFLGERSDVPRLLRSADVYCQPNTSPESFGISFIEALYAGLPVITTAIGGAREIVDETCGVLLPPADPAALADRLAALIDDDGQRRRLGLGGTGAARRLCDPAGQLRRLRHVLASLSAASCRDPRGNPGPGAGAAGGDND